MSKFSLFGKSGAGNLPTLLCVQIETSQRIWYRLSHKTGEVTEIQDEAFTADKPYLSLTADDFRVESPEKLSNANAKSLLARNIDTMDTMLSINHSNKGVIYGTTLPRMSAESSDALPSPLVMVADDFLKGKNKVAPLILAIVFKESVLTVILAYTASGNVQYQAAISNDNPQATAFAFSQACGLPENAEVIFATKEELFQGIRSLDTYPMGGGLASLNLNKVLPAISRLSVVGAIGIAGWGYQMDMQLKDVNAQIEAAKLRDANAQILNAELFKKNPVGIAQYLSADWKKGFSDVSQLYVEGSVAESLIDTKAVSHSIITAFKTAGKKGLGGLVPDNLIAETLDKPTPAGCQRVSVEFTGGLNEVKSKYSCVGPHNSITRFGF